MGHHVLLRIQLGADQAHPARSALTRGQREADHANASTFFAVCDGACAAATVVGTRLEPGPTSKGDCDAAARGRPAVSSCSGPGLRRDQQDGRYDIGSARRCALSCGRNRMLFPAEMYKVERSSWGEVYLLTGCVVSAHHRADDALDLQNSRNPRKTLLSAARFLFADIFPQSRPNQRACRIPRFREVVNP
jgi:hypothetical protein